MSTKRVRVVVDAVGHGTVEIDGEPLGNVREITLRAGVERVTEVDVTLVNVEVDVEAEVAESRLTEHVQQVDLRAHDDPVDPVDPEVAAVLVTIDGSWNRLWVEAEVERLRESFGYVKANEHQHLFVIGPSLDEIERAAGSWWEVLSHREIDRDQGSSRG